MLSRIFRDEAENIRANRKRQIDTLKVFNDNVTEIEEDVEYKVDFRTEKSPMCLHITLPQEFPNEKPKIGVEPPVTHPWVDNNCDISNAPGLLNFTAHSDLGRVVQVIIREFQIRPPDVLGHNLQMSPEKIQLLPVSSNCYAFPELVTMTKEELELLNDNPDKLEEFVSSLKVYEDSSRAIDARIEQVEALAKENLGKQAILEKLRKKVLKKVEQARKLKASFDEKNKEYEKLCQQYQPQNIQQVLNVAAVQSDEESDVVANKFLNKEISVEQFLTEYGEKRKISQLRKTKEEKLSNQLKELYKAGY